jgi:hypothetical protein
MRRKSALVPRLGAGLLLGWLLSGIGASPLAVAGHPSTASLLPDTTAALLWTPNAPDATERFLNPAPGRICRDPQMRPLVDQFFRSLAESRRGVLKMLALAPVDTTPERWVPADVSTYTTLNWDVQAAFDAVREVFDSFRGEGASSDE